MNLSSKCNRFFPNPFSLPSPHYLWAWTENPVVGSLDLKAMAGARVQFSLESAAIFFHLKFDFFPVFLLHPHHQIPAPSPYVPQRWLSDAAHKILEVFHSCKLSLIYTYSLTYINTSKSHYYLLLLVNHNLIQVDYLHHFIFLSLLS